ncbi:MAG TPA: xanthine dehydrogenase family protein subunit M [Bryobacteraceae bacterium]|nr:xanthine dehydrogenase family protein subunit M [Bryobacteraceae bacterium]
MIAQNFEYESPTNLKDALGLLAEEDVKVLAGGMSLIPLMKLRLATPAQLVDIGRIADLNFIHDEGGMLRIGATTTHYQLESSPIVRSRCPLLAEAASHIGDIQVRNMGTIGGSIAHADPAADYPASLLALEAKVALVSAKSKRELSISEFFVDTFTTALAPGEIVQAVVVPIEDQAAGTSYQKVVQPASGFAIVGVAARIRKSGGKIAMCRVGVTGLTGAAFRAVAVEKALEGTAGSPSDIQKASTLVAQGVDANSDLHASAEYRKHLAQVYTMRALAVALSRAA